MAGLHADTPGVTPKIRARALADKAMLSSWLEVFDAATMAQEALTLAREVGDPYLVARALTSCGSCLALDHETAGPYFSEGIALARELNDSWRLCQILGRQTYSAFVGGDLDTTEQVAREGMALADMIGDQFGVGQCAWALIGVAMHRGEALAAKRMLDDHIARATAAHDLMSRVTGLMLKAYALGFNGDAEGARAAGESAAQLGRELLGTFERATYSAITVACLADGDLPAAWEATLRADQSGTNPTVDALNLVWMAQAALAVGELDTARRWADTAVAHAKSSWHACSVSLRANVHLARGDYEPAAADAYEALAAAASTAHTSRRPTPSNASHACRSALMASPKQPACSERRTP